MQVEDEVGAYEVKTHWSAYLRRVREGRRYVVTQRGQPVAELSPYVGAQSVSRANAVREMGALMDSAPAQDLPVDIKSLIAHGRD